MAMTDAIEDKIKDLFIADSNLDSVKVFLSGEPLEIPINLYPLSVIFLTQQAPAKQETGIWVYTYTGYLSIETLIPDRFTVTARKATMPSYATVRALLDAMTNVLETNQALDNLTDGTETVRVITRGEKVYGLEQRSDNITNRGSIPINVETQKPRS